jgi:hypothetical protein
MAYRICHKPACRSAGPELDPRDIRLRDDISPIGLKSSSNSSSVMPVSVQKSLMRSRSISSLENPCHASEIDVVDI